MLQKKNVILTVDTECSGLSNPVYDIGWTIHDKTGKIVESFHALVREVFTDADEMTRAYFAKKVFTDYAPMLDLQDIRLKNWSEIVGIMRDHIKTHNVNILSAYNLGFDLRALKLTNKLFGDSAVIQTPVKLLDLWQFSCEVLLNTPTYKKMAKANGWISPAGNIRTSAEMAYRFISGNVKFIESHTALDDAIIETEIAEKCYRKKSKIPYGKINAQPWKIVNA
jgi:hypothetical protein